MKFYFTMCATQVLPEELSEKIAEEDDGVEVVGFIVIDAKRFEIKKGETKIGRDPTMCSVVIENFTVSKVHAVIESEGVDDTFIYDVESTNQTKLGKKILKPHCRYKLEHYSNITFGNITAKFMLPHETRKNSESKFNLGEPEGVEDIFDVATQVGVSHPHISGKVLHIEEVPDNVKIFKIPDLGSGKKVKESPGSSNSSTEVIKCQLDTQDLGSRAEFYSASFDASNIFSLSTQCQITQSSSKENKSEDKACTDNQRNNKLDSVKSLLNDGHDSVLCTFMSLHSPDGQAPCKLVEVKTEIAEDNLNQIFDEQTQAYAILPQASGENVQQDLFSQDTLTPSIKGTPLDNRFKLNCRSKVSKKKTTNAEPVEDFMETQEFNINSTLEACGNALLSEQNVDKTSVQTTHQVSDIECHFRKNVDFSTAEEPTENEDLISTQKYEVLDGSIQGDMNNAPENEELSDTKEDLMETQLYDIEEEWSKNIPEQGTAERPTVSSESPERDSELYVEGNTALTQRNIEEDYISTQVFGEMTCNRDADISNSGSQGRNDDVYNDEDFITTQPVDLLVISPAKYKCVQEPSSRIQIASRESSPDLLDSGFSAKASTDFINRSPEADFPEFSEQIDSVFSTNIKKELDEGINTLPATDVERVESSGDETESDLEIIFDKSDTAKKTTRAEEFSNNAQSQQSEDGASARSLGEDDNDGSNSSYVFQLEPEVQENIVNNQGRADNSDSDATVCEDIAGFSQEMPMKHELLGKVSFEETQVLTLTTPDNFPQVPSPKDDCVTDKESPRFDIGNDNECWSQLSVEMPNTQDMETTINKIIHNNYMPAQKRDQKHEDHQAPSKILKTEVGTEDTDSNSTHRKSAGQVDSPLKRPGNSSIEVEAVPTKKSKMEASERKLRSSEKQLLKLWQAHDIEQIQPSRTRNSLKNPVPQNILNETDISLGKNISNKLATSRRETRTKRKNSRKLGFDITSYLCNKMENNKSPRGSKKEAPPKENTRASLVGKKETPMEHGVEPKSVECCHRVLRSSRRNSGNVLPAGSPARNAASSRSRRNSRVKSEEYFSNSCVHVVFTGFDNESLEQIISNLGGKKTNDLSLGDVVVADKVRRTVKLLSAISLSLPITSPQWLLASRAEKRFQNPWNFILKDDESERKWNFELRASLERSKKAKLMQGLSIFATANTKPPVKDLLAIVECCGGTPLFDPPDRWPKKTIIVSCPEDKNYWPLAKYRNIKIVHYEFILSGVLSQKLDFKTYKLR